MGVFVFTLTFISLFCQALVAQEKINLAPSIQSLGLNMNVIITRSEAVETHAFIDLMGQVYEIKSYLLPNLDLIFQEEIKPNGRIQQFFNEKGELFKQITLTRIESGKSKFQRQVHFPVLKHEKKELEQDVDKSRGRLNACSERLMASVSSIDDIKAVMTPDNGDAFQLAFNGCTDPSERTIKPKMESALITGINCLLDPKRGGSARGQRDAQLLYQYLHNQTFTINCQGIVGSVGADYDGMASDCPDENPSNKAAFPGMSISQSRYRARPSRGRDLWFSRLTFHEALHNVGHTHGQSPEATQACERCCFPDGLSNSAKKAVCELCRAPDNAASNPDYLASFIMNFRNLGYSDDVEGGDELTATAMALKMMGPYLSRDPALIGKTVAAMIMQCSGTSSLTLNDFRSFDFVDKFDLKKMSNTCATSHPEAGRILRMTLLLLQTSRQYNNSGESSFSTDQIILDTEINGMKVSEGGGAVALWYAANFTAERLRGKSVTASDRVAELSLPGLVTRAGMTTTEYNEEESDIVSRVQEYALHINKVF